MRWLAVISVVLATNATGQELPIGPGQILQFGMGIRSCAAWLQNDASEITGNNWILGYWTGMNESNANHAVGNSTDALGIFGEIKKTCTEDPALSLREATASAYWSFDTIGR